MYHVLETPCIRRLGHPSKLHNQGCKRTPPLFKCALSHELVEQRQQWWRRWQQWRGTSRELHLQLRLVPPGERIEADQGQDRNSSSPISVCLAMSWWNNDNNGGVGGSGARGASRELQLQLRLVPSGERIKAYEVTLHRQYRVSSDNRPASSRSVLVVGGCSRCMQYFMVPKRDFPICMNSEHPTLFDPLDRIGTGGLAGDKTPMSWWNNDNNGGVGGSGARGASRELQLQLRLVPSGERIKAYEGHNSNSSSPISCVSSNSSRSVLVVGGCSRCMQYFMVPKRDFPICMNSEHPTLFDPLDRIGTGGLAGDKKRDPHSGTTGFTWEASKDFPQPLVAPSSDNVQEIKLSSDDARDEVKVVDTQETKKSEKKRKQ
ncbi:hypothetical protein EJB05_27034, partial [Eragrostis curvula]